MSNGQYLMQRKNGTSFTDSEERDMKMFKIMPFLLEADFRKRGVTIQASENWTPKSVIDGRLVTGRNPQSGPCCAREHPLGCRVLELNNAVLTGTVL